MQATVQELALPFPLVDNQQPALAFVPFMQSFNTELFQVKNRQPGTYRLTIDSVLVGQFSASQLAQGINLAEFIQTPQYQQAVRVRRVLTDLWKIEADLRAIRYVEHAYLRTYRGAADSTSINRYLDSLHTARFPDNAYIKTQFNLYSRLKAHERSMILQADSLRQVAHEANQPQPHRFVVERLTAPGVVGSDRSLSPLPASVRRVVVLGNSITYAGTYVTFIDAYFRLHYPNQPVEFINLGLPSETVSGLSEDGHADGKFPRPDLHERLSRLLTLTKPDLVIACYGMNDGIYLPLDKDPVPEIQGRHKLAARRSKQSRSEHHSRDTSDL